MNLIYEEWIPVRRADGTLDKIAPYQVTEDIEDESRRIMAVASPRPDFDGALTQFLIGLVQTACTPESDTVWWKWRESPPEPDNLKARFAPFEKAFESEGEGPKFMQDFTPS